MSEAPAGRARLWLVAKVVGVALLIALPIWGRSIAEGRAELGLAQQARAQGELDEAIVDQELARYADRLPDDVTGA